MNKAALFPGVALFLWKCKLNKAEVFIVSHKTEYGHFDEEKINLREAALDWMRQTKFFNEEEFAIPMDNVFFALTRAEKVKKINELKLSFFIDDLIEVFEEENFSEQTQKVLFGNSIESKQSIEKLINFNNWKNISDYIFPELKSSDILHIINEKWKDLQLTDIKTIKANGNSRVYKLDTNDKSYILKIYPDLQLDPRERLKTEYNCCSKLSDFQLLVPKPICKDENLNWGIYSWIEGNEITENREEVILQLIQFLKNLSIINNKFTFESFSLASEACLSGFELESQLRRRIGNLISLNNSELNHFLKENLEIVLNSLVEKAKFFYKDEYNIELERERWVLNPSDFGFHNSKMDFDGKLYIYDLEYFGWDDPVKLISDFLWHPGMNLTDKEKELWLNHTMRVFKEDEGIEKRFALYYPLYGIRWCLILLNEFLKTKLENRINADPDRKEKLSSIKNIQLEKSKSLLEKIKSIA
jgi:hypothetical protein